MTGAVFMILFIKNHIVWFPSLQHCNWFGFRISLSLSREGAIFRDEIENYFSCSRLVRRDRDYHMTILVFRDENEIPFCYSHFETRSRLQKIISHGRARKNEADSRREFPGSKILADLWVLGVEGVDRNYLAAIYVYYHMV